MSPPDAVRFWDALAIVEALDLVVACPHRGKPLRCPKHPGGCRCGEKSTCRKGEPVTLADCIRCVTGQEPR